MVAWLYIRRIHFDVDILGKGKGVTEMDEWHICKASGKEKKQKKSIMSEINETKELLESRRTHVQIMTMLSFIPINLEKYIYIIKKHHFFQTAPFT